MINIQTSQIQAVYITQPIQILKHTLTAKYHTMMMIKLYSNLFYNQFGNFNIKSQHGYDSLAYYLKQERLFSFYCMEDTAERIKNCIWQRITKDRYAPILSHNILGNIHSSGHHQSQRLKNTITLVNYSNTLHSQSSYEKNKDKNKVNQIKQLKGVPKTVNDLGKRIQTICAKDSKCKLNLLLVAHMANQHIKTNTNQTQVEKQYDLRKPLKISKPEHRQSSKTNTNSRLKTHKKENSKNKSKQQKRKSNEISKRNSQVQTNFVPMTPKPTATQLWTENKLSKHPSRTSLSRNKYNQKKQTQEVKKIGKETSGKKWVKQRK